MYAVDYQKPKSVADAAALLAKTGGKALAGGQSLVAAMKLRLAQPGTLVDLAAIPDLNGIRKDGDAIVIGAMTRHAEVASSEDVKRAIPALASLAEGIGDRQVRNMGTLGGSHRQQRSRRRLAGGGASRSNATVVTNKRRIAAARFLQGHVRDGARRRRDHRCGVVPDSEEGGVREVSESGVALRAGRRLRRARRGRRGARRGDRRDAFGVPRRTARSGAREELHRGCRARA